MEHCSDGGGTETLVTSADVVGFNRDADINVDSPLGLGSRCPGVCEDFKHDG